MILLDRRKISGCRWQNSEKVVFLSQQSDYQAV